MLDPEIGVRPPRTCPLKPGVGVGVGVGVAVGVGVEVAVAVAVAVAVGVEVAVTVGVDVAVAVDVEVAVAVTVAVDVEVALAVGEGVGVGVVLPTHFGQGSHPLVNHPAPNKSTSESVSMGLTRARLCRWKRIKVEPKPALTTFSWSDVL